jgi:hypothetical protein
MEIDKLQLLTQHKLNRFSVEKVACDEYGTLRGELAYVVPGEKTAEGFRLDPVKDQAHWDSLASGKCGERRPSLRTQGRNFSDSPKLNPGEPEGTHRFPIELIAASLARGRASGLFAPEHASRFRHASASLLEAKAFKWNRSAARRNFAKQPTHASAVGTRKKPRRSSSTREWGSSEGGTLLLNEISLPSTREKRRPLAGRASFHS